MIEAGILENPHVDAALMFHDIAGSPVKEGTVGVFGPGAVYASSGRFEIHIKGVGGHGAAPDWTHNPLGAVIEQVFRERISGVSGSNHAKVPRNHLK